MDPGTLVLAAQTGLDPLREKFGPIDTHKTRLELTNSAEAARADRYVMAVMAWSAQARDALQAQPDHMYAEQLRIVYDDHVGEAIDLARLGYGGPTALAAFMNTLKDDVPKRLAVGGAGLLAAVVVLALLLALRR